MTNPMIKIHDLTTGEEIEREMNAEEFAKWDSENAQTEAESQTQINKATAKSELLAKLGITQDEALLLLS
jgi:hypothetical protein